MGTVVGVDADLVLYASCYANEDNPLSYCLNAITKTVERIIKRTEADTCILYLTGKGNYREAVATISPYKAGRPPKPTHFQEAKDFLINKKGALLVEGMEADDMLGIMASQMEEGDKYILASYDKDLDMIPCTHYVWSSKKREERWYEVEDPAGMRFFYTQLLTGDSTDNIAGLFKMTGKKAMKKIKQPLEEMNEEIDMWNYVRGVYRDAYLSCGILPDLVDDTIDKWLLEIGRLLWIRREADEELWEFPTKGG